MKGQNLNSAGCKPVEKNDTILNNHKVVEYNYELYSTLSGLILFILLIPQVSPVAIQTEAFQA